MPKTSELIWETSILIKHIDTVSKIEYGHLAILLRVGLSINDFIPEGGGTKDNNVRYILRRNCGYKGKEGIAKLENHLKYLVVWEYICDQGFRNILTVFHTLLNIFIFVNYK